jgi:hypothetical protein
VTDGGDPRGPYRGRRIALATLHGKAAAIGPAVRRHLGADLVVPPGLDTDAFGTFAGDVPRTGTMGETALAKARAGMAASGERLGLASEGTYGPHPTVPLLTSGLELMVFVDDDRDLVVFESLVDPAPRFDRALVGPDDDLGPLLARADLPRHALVVAPHAPAAAGEGIARGLRDPDAVPAAVRAAAAAGADGLAAVTTDLRAHMNPTRMATLARLADALCRRLATPCPACGAPGFGRLRAEPGLPCGLCGMPTGESVGMLSGCAACGHRALRPRADGRKEADPGSCPACNP